LVSVSSISELTDRAVGARHERLTFSSDGFDSWAKSTAQASPTKPSQASMA
jgi:hypothetical protein